MATEIKQQDQKEPAGIEIDPGAAKKARAGAEGFSASLMEKLAERIGANAGARAPLRRVCGRQESLLEQVFEGGASVVGSRW